MSSIQKPSWLVAVITRRFLILCSNAENSSFKRLEVTHSDLTKRRKWSLQDMAIPAAQSLIDTLWCQAPEKKWTLPKVESSYLIPKSMSGWNSHNWAKDATTTRAQISTTNMSTSSVVFKMQTRNTLLPLKGSNSRSPISATPGRRSHVAKVHWLRVHQSQLDKEQVCANYPRMK